jgi:hypothetical protein
MARIAIITGAASGIGRTAMASPPAETSTDADRTPPAVSQR